jgi:hypothetical protein
MSTRIMKLEEEEEEEEEKKKLKIINMKILSEMNGKEEKETKQRYGEKSQFGLLER